MNQRSTKTDNKSIPNKIQIREEAIKDLSEVRVLDLFAGRNTLWSNIRTDKYYGIELQKDKGNNLLADTRDVLTQLDYSDYNVIDCDSYGIPFDILKYLFRNKLLSKGTIVLYTAITNEFTKIQNVAKQELNFAGFYDKAPSLFNANAIEFFYEFLAMNDVKEVNYYEIRDHFKKHYGYFKIG